MSEPELIERLCGIVSGLIEIVKRQQYQIEQMGEMCDEDEWEDLQRQIRVVESEAGPVCDWR